jgi:1,2-diacylglycerol 3-beta-galactosyltransferase
MKILILLSDTGGGHRAIARAVSWGLRQTAGGAAKIEELDIFAIEPIALHDRITRLYEPLLRRWPDLYGWLYHLSDRPGVYGALTVSARRHMVPKLRDAFSSVRPVLIVSVHPLANQLALDALQEVGCRIPYISVVTELVMVHRAWVEPDTACYAVATEETRQGVLKLGAPTERVYLTGLPVDERCGRRQPSVTDLRLSLGLDPHRFTALFIGGGVGAGGIAERVKIAARSGFGGQIVVVCGRNEGLRRWLASQQFPVPVYTYGFVSNVPELMRASDVVVSKSGPQTLAEALACARPVIVYRQFRGQEEGNGAFIERHGAGYLVPDPRLLAETLIRLSRDDAEIDRLRDAAAQLGRPEAAIHAASVILDRVGVAV